MGFTGAPAGDNPTSLLPATTVRRKPPPDWMCFCCSKRNKGDLSTCCVCGRPRGYIIRREVLPLHGDAGLYYRKEQVAALYDEGREDGDIGETDEMGWSSLHYVSAMGNRDLLVELLDLGASVSATTGHGMSPLHLAAQSGVLDSVTACLTAGADINAQTKFEQSTPLHLAIERQHKNVAFYLIDAGAKVNVPNSVGRTPLHVACASGQFDLAAYLVRNGADVRAFDAHGWNARQIAELHGHRDIEEMLVRCTMVVAQAVIVDMPEAEWHSTLWSDVKRNYQTRDKTLKSRPASRSGDDMGVLGGGGGGRDEDGTAGAAAVPGKEGGGKKRFGYSNTMSVAHVSTLARSAATTLSK